jgi:outer membrane receptor protein involved in Fe transport
MIRKCLVLGVSLLFVTGSYAQFRFLTDSVDRRSDSLKIYPGRSSIASSSLGNYANTATNGINMQTYAGFNIANTLRGHVPNLDLNANVASVGGDGLRYNNTMLLIDGMAFSAGISSYYNLNSFEYQSIGAISSGNQFALYGGLGSNGAIILESKNGSGISKPFFEGNSSTSFIHTPSSSVFSGYQTEPVDQWVFTNAVAYAQDYGQLDLRVSYTNTFIPDVDAERTTTNRNALRLNLGLELSPRFSMRLIADSRYVTSDGLLADSNFDISETKPSFNGNLFMKFVVNDWLVLSSQGGVARTKHDRETSQVTLSTDYLDRQSRDMVNVLATITPRINERLQLTFVTGGQMENQGLNREYSYRDDTFSGAETWDMDGKLRTWLAQGRLVLNDVFFADLNYRYDYLKDADEDQKNQPHYSLNTSFDFAKAFSLQRGSFSAGRVRFSAGKFNMLEATGFPYNGSGTSPINSPWNPGGMIPNPGIKPTSRNSIETGTDLSFADSRISFNATYFNSLNNQTLTYMYTPTPGGPQSVLVDMGPQRMEGWEFALGAYPTRTENMAVFTKLLYGRYKSFIQPEEGSDFPGLELDNGMPDWTGSFLGQLELDRFFASMLVTHQKGGQITIFDGAIYPPLTSNQTQMWLQDVSVGYKFSKVSVSLSGRNLWNIIDKRDENDFYGTPLDKTVTASITVKI